MNNHLEIISNYPQEIKQKVEELINSKMLTKYLLKKYSKKSAITSDKQLYSFVMEYKNSYFKKYKIDKIEFCSKIKTQNALGMHTFISRVQGAKLKAKNEIRVATIFKNAPIEFLETIVIHELSHLKEKEHNKSFYDMCSFVKKDYIQTEFDLRLYLIHLKIFGNLHQ